MTDPHTQGPGAGPAAGSVCSGYGGLDLAAAYVFGTRPVWFADNDPAAAAVLAHHWPGVPNLGDIRAVDWTDVYPVDVFTGGTPCQDLSAAGKRAGLTRSTRSGVWHSMCDAVEILRPPLVLWENVRGALSAKADSAVEPCPRCLGDRDNRRALRALGRVLGDLADLGYDAVWCGLPAAAVGCAHLRWRIFVAAVDTRARNWPLTLAQWCTAAAADPGRHEGPQDDADGAAAARGGRDTVADADRVGLRQQPVADGGREGSPVAVVAGAVDVVADPVGGGRDRRTHQQGRSAFGGTAVGRDRAAAAADAQGLGHDREVRARGRRPGPEEHGGGAVADTAGSRRGPAQPGDDGGDGGETVRVGAPEPGRRGGVAADADGDQRERQQDQQPGGVAVAGGGRRPHPTGHTGSGIDWREYTAAIRHHELIFGRPAPDPTIEGMRGQPKLSPWFTEWLMALPAGHVTGVPGLTANQQLKLCGNGVVIAQAVEAFRWLAARLLDTMADCTDCPDCDGCQDEGVA